MGTHAHPSRRWTKFEENGPGRYRSRSIRKYGGEHRYVDLYHDGSRWWVHARAHGHQYDKGVFGTYREALHYARAHRNERTFWED